MKSFMLVAVMNCLVLGCDVPRDCADSHANATGGVLRVGIAENRPWTCLKGDRPRGREVALIEAFAAEIDAHVAWTNDSESDLLEMLERGELDVVVCGLRKSTLWSHRVGLTVPHTHEGGEKHVLAVRAGENRMLLELDRFIQRYVVE